MLIQMRGYTRQIVNGTTDRTDIIYKGYLSYIQMITTKANNTGGKHHLHQVMQLAWPAILSNITTPLLSLVDIAIVGHLPSQTAIGAVAVGGTAFNMLYWLFGFLRMGTSGLTAQAYGKGDAKERSLVLMRALYIALLGATLLLALAPFAASPALRLIDPAEATLSQATSYFMILIWGAPAVLATYSLAGWFLGMQNSRMPLVMALVTNISNIAVSVTTVYVFGMGIEGCAIGTLTAQWLGALTGIAVLLRRYKLVRVKFTEVVESRELLKFLKVNVYIFLRTLCLVAVTMWFTHAGAEQSVEILSANAVLLQFFMLYSYFIDGFGFAGEALVGRYCGASDCVNMRRVIKVLFKTGLVIGASFTVAYFCCGDLILNLLTDKSDVVATAREYLPWVVSIPLLGMSAFLYDGIFIGLTRTWDMFLSMLSAAGMFFLLYFIFTPLMGNHALWMAFVAYLGIRGLILHIFLKRYTPKMSCK